MDDDNYVNPRALLKLLKAFPQTHDVYVGRPSLNRPIRASEPRPHNRTVSLFLPPWCIGQGCPLWPGGGRSQAGAGPGGGAGPRPWRSEVASPAFIFGLLAVCLGW